MSQGWRRWSQLQKDIESRFADSIGGRLRLRCVGYRGAHDGDGRCYFTFDGKEIGNCCTLSSMVHRGGRFNPECHDGAIPLDWSNPPSDDERKTGETMELGEFSQGDVLSTCLAYRNISIEDALCSKNPIMLALAVVDRRVGKRRLRALREQPKHPLVAKLYELRLACEAGG
ncbi:hypothetical protein MNBD_PLANCTO03-1327 [hydrothermal vent metagenome]|uniref:Uncharacterized protein n=1 Tax=hydrothermal vent metagenome TaxID=652676 RepID=A0A3B1DDU2_9ZZZZ